MCNCIDRMNAKLAGRNARLSVSAPITKDLDFTQTSGKIVTDKIDQTKDQAIPPVIVGFCLFWGKSDEPSICMMVFFSVEEGNRKDKRSIPMNNSSEYYELAMALVGLDPGCCGDFKDSQHVSQLLLEKYHFSSCEDFEHLIEDLIPLIAIGGSTLTVERRFKGFALKKAWLCKVESSQ